LSDAVSIFVVGVGSAYESVIWLLNNHGMLVLIADKTIAKLSTDRLQDLTTHVFSFVAESNLLGVSRPADDFFSNWYYNHSHVFVAENHGVWSPDRTRKVRRKYGRIIKSESITINDMLLEHREQVFQKIKEETEDWRSSNQEGPNPATPVTPTAAEINNGTTDSAFPIEVKPDIGGVPGEPLKTPGTPSQIKSERMSASPNPVRSSPGRIPPMGMFTVTSPERLERERMMRE
jgi:hypothetical protein